MKEEEKVSMTPSLAVGGGTMNKRKTNYLLGKVSSPEVNNLCSQRCGGKPLYVTRNSSQRISGSVKINWLRPNGVASNRDPLKETSAQIMMLKTNFLPL